MQINKQEDEPNNKLIINKQSKHANKQINNVFKKKKQKLGMITRNLNILHAYINNIYRPT